MLWFFLEEKDICKDQIMNSQNNFWLALSPHDVLMLRITKHQVHIMVFVNVPSHGDIRSSLIFPHGFILDMEAYIMCLEQVVLPYIRKGSRWQTLYLATGHCTLTHELELCVGCQKISTNTSPLMTGSLTLLSADPLIIRCGLWLKKGLTKYLAIPKMNWRQG